MTNAPRPGNMITTTRTLHPGATDHRPSVNGWTFAVPRHGGFVYSYITRNSHVSPLVYSTREEAHGAIVTD